MYLRVSRLRILCCLTMFSYVAGCEKPSHYKCEGVITHNGQPVPNLQITFSPVIVDSVRSPIGLTNADGQFEMTTGRFRGVPPGKYKVFVEDPRAADGLRSNSEEAYLYVVSRYCELNSDVQYVADKDRIDFELKHDTRELPAAASAETAEPSATPAPPPANTTEAGQPESNK